MSLVDRSSEVLAKRWADERTQIAAAMVRAEELFNEGGDTVTESKLIEKLRRERVKPRLAAAAVDWLESTGKATKDWNTGLLSHP